MDKLKLTVEKYLPEVADSARICKEKGAILILHQDAFAAGYHRDEFLLLGMAVKYCGLLGVSFMIEGKNHETFGDRNLARGTKDSTPDDHSPAG